MELLERESCIAELTQRLNGLPGRGGSVVLIGGDAGIGKTALLQKVCSALSGVRVLWGACDDLFTPRRWGRSMTSPRRRKARCVRRFSPRTSTRLDPHGLTAREAEVLGLMADGLTNAAIAKRLFVSPRTVDHHVSAILTKLGAKTRSAAVAQINARKADPG